MLRRMTIAMGVVAFAATAAPGVLAAEPAGQALAGVQTMLDASASAWNSGDLDRFMTCYEDAPTITYVSGTRLVHGYQAIRAMYAERFGSGSKAAMGQLSIEIVDFRLIANKNAYVVGRFHLHRDAAHGGDASGPTTLLFRRTSAGWRIIADHS